jgi:hypothetical protein
MDRKGWSLTKFAAEADLAEGTVRSALQGKNVSADTLNALARELRVQQSALLIHTSDHQVGARYRDISGNWSGYGKDIALPPDITYNIKPVNYKFQVSISQTELDFEAEGQIVGQEGIEQPFTAQGHLREDGNYVIMQWVNADPTINDYGIALLEYTADGKRLEGYFLGRERIHNSNFIFGNVCATRVKPERKRVI